VAKPALESFLEASSCAEASWASRSRPSRSARIKPAPSVRRRGSVPSMGRHPARGSQARNTLASDRVADLANDRLCREVGCYDPVQLAQKGQTRGRLALEEPHDNREAGLLHAPVEGFVVLQHLPGPRPFSPTSSRKASVLWISSARVGSQYPPALRLSYCRMLVTGGVRRQRLGLLG
jgi:hypothetical protein